MLKDKCRKHIILDIYCKILPLDKEYIDGHHGQMCNDVDCMLDKKGMSATQYLTSCYESTNAPLLEFILRSTDAIGKSYMEAAEETLKNAQENDAKLTDPKEPDTEDEDVKGQLVDIKKDPEYESFIDKLKQKTINKIVSDVSKIIADKKEEKEMTFDTDPAPIDAEVAEESAVGVGMNYLQKNLWNEKKEFDESKQEEMIGMAIREATQHQFDVVFKQPMAEFREFVSMIRFGKGIVINENAVNHFRESAN